MERGIAVDCWGGRGDAWQRAQRLHDKMKTNLGMAKDRLHFLGMHKIALLSVNLRYFIFILAPDNIIVNSFFFIMAVCGMLAYFILHSTFPK